MYLNGVHLIKHNNNFFLIYIIFALILHRMYTEYLYYAIFIEIYPNAPVPGVTLQFVLPNFVQISI
jgi:hypothetical protein